MIVGVVTDFEMTLRGDIIKVAWQNNFIFSFKPQKKNGLGPLKQEGHDGPVSLHWLILGNLFKT